MIPALVAAAMAQESWTTGVIPRVPTSTAVEIQWRHAVDQAWLQEAEVQAGGTFWRSRTGGFGFGGTGRAMTTIVTAPNEQRLAGDLSGLGATIWLMGWGPDRRSWHAGGLDVIGAPMQASGMLHDQHEAAVSFSATYGGWVQANRFFGVGLSAEAGIDLTNLFHAVGGVSFVVTPTETFAMHAGVEAGLTRVGVAEVGLRGRIGDRVELGGAWWFPLYTLDGSPLGTLIRPSIDLKVYWAPLAR